MARMRAGLSPAQGPVSGPIRAPGGLGETAASHAGAAGGGRCVGFRNRTLTARLLSTCSGSGTLSFCNTSSEGRSVSVTRDRWEACDLLVLHEEQRQACASPPKGRAGGRRAMQVYLTVYRFPK